MDQKFNPSGALTPTPEREDGITRGCTLMPLIRPILKIPTALHEGGVPSNVLSEQLGHNAPDLYYAKTQSEVRNRGEREDHGTVAEQPEAPFEHSSSDEDAYDTAHSGGWVSLTC